MSNEYYLQDLRRQYIDIGESYVQAIREGRSKTEIRDITRNIKSILVEIRAVEQELRRTA